MLKNISFYIKLLLLTLLFIDNSYSIELLIIPLKKPFLDKITKQNKITQGIIKPKSKPIKKIEKEGLAKEIKKPSPKPSKKVEKQKLPKEITKTESEHSKKTVNKIIKKEIKKTSFLIPKSKPLTVKKTSTAKKTRSKFYSQKDFNIAKQSIKAIEKRQWTTALSLSKKAKDKSIYNFIQWRHLLTTGNQATFYDYLTFIKNNEDYPRINRVRYLAEHKLY